MKQTNRRNPYFEDQPPLTFLEELTRPLHTAHPKHWNERRPSEDEADARGAFLVPEFADERGLLASAYDDFSRFLSIHCVKGDPEPRPYPIKTVYAPTACFEAYKISVTRKGCILYAADTEGIRRGLVYLEDEMLRRAGCFLPLGEISRRPVIRTRISRSFYSPINRPPKNLDELWEETDYYPDEYLNRLAHDAVNGVWIYTKFRELLPSSYRLGFDPGYQRRLDKLRRLTEKCARYGIRPYVFAIEPAELSRDEAERYPAFRGASRGGGRASFCTSTEEGRAYCVEAVRNLLEAVPGIGGLIVITHGERGTACGSGSMVIDCPRCKEKPVGEVLAQTADCFTEGFREEKETDSAEKPREFVSWTYGHRLWNEEAIRDYVRAAPADAMLMQNFEEMGYTEQLGKTRLALDYWLSYPGPSQMFRATAEEARKCEKHLFAKTQVCCSHECATVPYVPVPGLLFDKYRAMREYGVEGVMQCWYFGNYPSMMSRAAGELAFCGDFSDKDAFLLRLAGIYYGEDAPAAVRAWKCFEEGYRQYPVNIMFSYYGPMHDGPIWKLRLLPKNLPLPRSWQTLDCADGDRIGECLLCGHTLDETITLCTRMSECWEQGLAELPADTGYEARDEQTRVARALGIQFASGLDILRFYRLRDTLGRLGYRTETRDFAERAFTVLEEMRRIVEAEKERSHALALLWERDGRLGYHSEGEGYKYFPRMLRDRIAALDTLLAEEFPAVRDRITAGLAPLVYYLGEEPDAAFYRMTEDPVSEAEWAELDRPGAAFRASLDGDSLVLELRDSVRGAFSVSPEMPLFSPGAHMTISADGVPEVSFYDSIYYQMFGEKKTAALAKWHVTAHEGTGTYLTVRLRIADYQEEPFFTPVKLKIVSPSGASFCGNRPPQGPLGKADMNPEDYFWLLPPQKTE